MGLSPLARGNPEHEEGQPLVRGPIPARAGEPGCAKAVDFVGGAYPRSRGGTNLTGVHPMSFMGLSPLARGNLVRP